MEQLGAGCRLFRVQISESKAEEDVQIACSSKQIYIYIDTNKWKRKETDKGRSIKI